jgi:transglutaminase-like putative cysteine protease
VVLRGLADDVAFEGRHQVTFTITPDTFRDPTVLSPQTPERVSEATRLTVVGKGGYFGALERDDRGSYTVDALTPVYGDGVGQLNEEALRAASTVYPDEIKQLYLGVADGALGPDATALRAKILAEAKSHSPYDLASQIDKELKSSTYHYQSDMRGFDCVGLSTVECFARYKHGFCQYYAITMAVLLRSMDVPTRLAVGFLPGTVDLLTGIERVRNNDAHAWVEVYFPGYGWVTFDPTGGNISQLAPLPSGKPVASRGPLPTPVGAGAGAPLGRRPDELGPTGGGTFTPTSVSPAPLIGVGVLLLLVVGGIAFIAWQRGPRGATSPDGAYGTVVRIASRLGFGPRPTQTVYEYAGSLGDVLPGARPELEMVAHAKVESSYGRVILGEDRVAALRVAQRRLRVSLLRLVLRRRDRPRRRRLG